MPEIRLEFFRNSQAEDYETAKDTGAVRELIATSKEDMVKQMYVLQETSDCFENMGYSDLGFRLRIEGSAKWFDQKDLSWDEARNHVSKADEYDKPIRKVVVLIFNEDKFELTDIMEYHFAPAAQKHLYDKPDYELLQFDEASYGESLTLMRSLSAEMSRRCAVVFDITATKLNRNIVCEFQTDCWPSHNQVFPVEKEYEVELKAVLEFGKLVRVTATSRDDAWQKAHAMAQGMVEADVCAGFDHDSWYIVDSTYTAYEGEYPREVNG